MNAQPDPFGITHIPLPDEAVREIVHDTDLDDERLWVPRGDSIWSLPLMFNVSTGAWVNITRASYRCHQSSSTFVAGDRLYPGWYLGVCGTRLTARRGTFIFEPPGETHTLVVRPEAGHMTVLSTTLDH